MIRDVQVRMARAALGWRSHQLASAAGVAVNTVSKFENGRDSQVSTVDALQRALETAGIQFIDADGRIGVTVTKERDD